MLVVMRSDATEEQIQTVVEYIERIGCKAEPIPGGTRTAIGVLYNEEPLDPNAFLVFPGVKDAIPVSKPYKMVSREMRSEDSVIDVGGVKVGGTKFTVIAGPCAVESLDQAMTIGRLVKAAGAECFRGGAFKPRTSPYSFQGLGEEGLKILAKVREETGLAIVTEAMDIDCLKMVDEYADCIQIGTRNMQNFSLLKAAGKAKKPVLLKRGMAATVDDFLMAAEYIISGGNSNVILCERGIRTFANHSRNTLDLNVVPAVKMASHLPIIVDPSHAAGRRDQVIPLARASAAVGAHGLLVEVHHQPELAFSDGPQSLLPEQFAVLMKEIRCILESCLVPEEASR